MADEQKIKHLVRIGNSDISGHKTILVALTKIKGIGFVFANTVCKVAGLDRMKKAGLLNSSEIEKLTDVISNPVKYNIPSWLFNRKKDLESGEDKHVMMGDLIFVKQQDIRRLQKVKSNRGLRHAAGLPLRGQRTKSNFRRNKGKAVGVKRKGGKSGRV